MVSTYNFKDTELGKTLLSGSLVISAQFRSVLEPMFDVPRTTSPCFDCVAWSGDTLMGIPENGLGYDAFIGWCSKSDFERNLEGLCLHLEDENFFDHLAHCLSLVVA